MKKEIGIWIDHHKAVIVILTMQGEIIRRIGSEIERFDHLSSSSTGNTPSEHIIGKQYENQLEPYYAKIISSIRDASSILIFGPGEAKRELEKQLERAGLEEHIVDIETEDEMTDRQISAKVHRYFPNNRRSNFPLEDTSGNELG